MLMTDITGYFYQLRYFIKGREYFIFLLFIIALFVGLIDALSISLLYPMLSVGFQINTDSIPIYGYIEKISSFIPIGSPFVHLGLLFIVLTGFSLILQLIYWKIAFLFQREVIINTKIAIFSKLKYNDYKFFVDSRQGDLINLFNQSPYFVQLTYDRLISFSTDLITSVIVILMLFFISPNGLLFVIIGGSIFYYVLNVIEKNISGKLGYLQMTSGQSENKVINEFITGIKPILALNASKHWSDNYVKALQVYWDKFAELNFIQRIPIIAINSSFYILIGVVVLTLYIYYADNFLIIIPLLGAFAAGLMKILPKVMNMGTYKLELKNYKPHVNTVFSILNDDTYNSIIDGNIQCDEIASDIYFKNINFSYGHTKILDNISFTIKLGRMTALVGPSGSGKSTLANLLLRLYDPSAGSIVINDKDLKAYNISSYRDIIGYVSQDSFVFNGSIKENIMFGETFSDHEVTEAAKLSFAHDFILQLPKGYDTIVGDQGVTLSGGEKQRIVIARAMIRRPNLLILDEATSALDYLSEAEVQKAIDHVAKECTTLIIAHRLSTIIKADNIIVIDKGKKIEEGSHSELLRIKGKYWQMINANESVIPKQD